MDGDVRLGSPGEFCNESNVRPFCVWVITSWIGSLSSFAFLPQLLF